MSGRSGREPVPGAGMRAHGARAGSRPRTRLFLLGALVFQGLSGLAGGIGLIGDPSGSALGIPAVWLDGSPFTDYLIPGVILLTVLGVAPLAAAAGLRLQRRWARPTAALVGAALVTWIIVQILIIGYRSSPPLQLVYGLAGASILALAILSPKEPP